MTAPFPAAHSILSPQALATQVLPVFGVGAGADVRFFQGGFNDTYVVTVQDSTVYYLRVYRHGWRTREDALYELDVLHHLRRKEIPVAYPISTKDGSFLVDVAAPEGPRFIALFALAKGRGLSYEGDPEPMARRYGSAVAAMHNALGDFESPHHRFHVDLAHLIDQPLAYVEPILSHRAEDWDYLRRFAGAVKRAIETLPEKDLERGVCHGDLQGYHAHEDAYGTLMFYDFDGGGFGYRTYDLAVFRWCARLQNQEDERWDAFLAAYRTGRAVSDLDVDAVPLFVCARHIWHMGVHAQNAPHWGYGGLDDAYYDGRIEQLRALEADYGIRV
jgi:Ser/Thr protein kinase RdoA (MazF antagonist)